MFHYFGALLVRKFPNTNTKTFFSFTPAFLQIIPSQPSSPKTYLFFISGRYKKKSHHLGKHKSFHQNNHQKPRSDDQHICINQKKKKKNI